MAHEHCLHCHEEVVDEDADFCGNDCEILYWRSQAEERENPMWDVRPWGRFRVIEEGDGYTVKELIVNPGHRTSYQSHEGRREVWVTIAGTGLAVINGFNFNLMSMLPPFPVAENIKHRIECPGPEELRIIEVWYGEDLREDDITRYEDDYERVPE